MTKQVMHTGHCGSDNVCSETFTMVYIGAGKRLPLTHCNMYNNGAF